MKNNGNRQKSDLRKKIVETLELLTKEYESHFPDYAYRGLLTRELAKTYKEFKELGGEL